MKKISLYLLLFLFSTEALQAQNDSIFLVGNARLYANNTVALRWNAVDALQYFNLSKSTFVVQRKTDLEDDYTIIATQNALPIEKWNININDKNQSKLIAAGALQNLSKQMLAFSSEIANQLEQLETCNLLWANISLMADLHQDIAALTQLGFMDKTVPKANEISYRVYFISDYFLSDTLEFSLYNETYVPAKMSQFFATEEDGYISFTIPVQKAFSGFYIQKSIGGKNSFTNLNNAPLVVPGNQGEKPVVYWTDSVKNYQQFDYRIYAIDMFGDTSEYSTTLTAQGRDRTPPPMVSGLQISQNSKNSLTISWDAFKSRDGEKGIAIGLRHLPDAAFIPLNEKLLPLNQTSFDLPLLSGETNYHISVQLFDTAGNSATTQAFYQLEDNTPPAAPKNVQALINKEGIVTLSWDWNEEADLGGYYVYFCNSKNGEFSGVQNVAVYDTVFFDTLSLAMLNRDVFYFVIAGDNRSNRSLSSDTIRVLRPDTLPPVAPSISTYTISDTAIYINWIPSSSIDVAAQSLHKKNNATGQIQIIQLLPKDSSYKDSKVTHAEEYTYFLQATDSSKNISPMSNSVILKPYKNYYRPAVSIVVAQYDSTANTATILWQYDTKNIERIELFRGKTINTIAYYPVQIAVDATSFVDTRIVKGQPYYYALQIHFKDGTKTKLSSPIGIAF